MLHRLNCVARFYPLISSFPEIQFRDGLCGGITKTGRLAIFFFCFLVVVTSASSLSANTVAEYDVSGPARVIDGDTLAVGSQVIRISGIDALEDAQSCSDSRGRSWQCGASATNALRKLSAGGVRCLGSEFDAYNRLIASCVANKLDIGKSLVLDGLALAYRRYSALYVADEAEAKKAGRGVWQGKFVEPWQWRETKWQQTEKSVPASGCPIKGNISKDGLKIYHAPWSRSYDRTRIDESKGERWFCDEAEAIAAGWRAPFR